MRTLLVEDHEDLSQVLAGGLRRAGFAVDTAATVVDAREAPCLATTHWQSLDLGLPDGSGLELLAEWRDRGHSRSLFSRLGCSGRPGRGLDSGADDYIVKPVEIPELVARCRAVLRRPGNRESVSLSAGRIRLDVANREATCNGQHVPLGRREFGVLEALVRAKGRVIARETLQEMLYDRDADVTPNAVDAAVSRVRRALDEAAADVSIRTIRGVGWMLRGSWLLTAGPMRRPGLRRTLATRLFAIAMLVVLGNLGIVAFFDASDRVSLLVDLTKREVLRLEAAYLATGERVAALAAEPGAIYIEHPGAYAFAITDAKGVIGGRNAALIPPDMLRPGPVAADWLAWPNGTGVPPGGSRSQHRGQRPASYRGILDEGRSGQSYRAEIWDEFLGMSGFLCCRSLPC